MTYISTQTVTATVHPIVAAATKSTTTNIKKLKIYLSKDGNDRQDTKQQNK
jgi:hypothetical protein